MTDYTTILSNVSSALTGAVGALVGVWVTNTGNDRRANMQSKEELGKERRTLTRERGEELYQHADKWQSNLRANSFVWLGVMEGHYTANDALDMEIRDNSNLKYDFGRIEMLVDVYFPNSREAFNAVIHQRDARGELLGKFKRSYKAGAEGGGFGPRLAESMNQLEQACRDFKKAVVEEIRDL